LALSQKSSSISERESDRSENGDFVGMSDPSIVALLKNYDDDDSGEEVLVVDKDQGLDTHLSVHPDERSK